MALTITQEIIWRGRGTGPTWFHPRATSLPDGSVLMTCQDVTGNDNFGQAHWSRTMDQGRTWSSPQPIAAFDRRDIGNGFEEGVCDSVPEYHAPSGKILVLGHTVFYKDNVLLKEDPPAGARYRHSVYTVGDGRGKWSVLRHLEWDNPRAAHYCMAGCAQRFTFDNGDVVVPLYIAPLGTMVRGATTVRCAFDGQSLTIIKAGRELNLEAGRGLLEPSITYYDGTFYLTIRAEDGHGYATRSSDALSWEDITPWTFDDGSPLEMSSTQQRWLIHKGTLHLVYTRKREDNHALLRWRAPLLIARVDPRKLQLIRETEQIVFPMDGDGTAADNQVALLGNFHTTAVAPDESWVTVGENRWRADWTGNTLLARIR